MSRPMHEIRKIDPEFKHKVMGLPGADKLMMCFQCGMCSSDCPVARRVDIFRPRTIVRFAVLGLKEALFDDGVIWLCTNCYTCQEHCPQGVKPTEVIEALREMAASEGKLHPEFRKMMVPLFRTGRIHRITRLKEKLRSEMGLPPVPEVPLDELQALFSLTGLDRILGPKQEAI